MRISLVLLAVSIIAGAFCDDEYSRPFVVAHRGYSAVAPENTLPAFILANQNGADGWETDLQLTKDNQLVCLHDATLDRTTNCSGYLSNFTYAELQDCDASYVDGQNFSQFRGAKIPLFSEVLDLAKNLSAFIVMDYKSDIPLGPYLAQVVPNASMTSRVFGSCWKSWQVVDIGQYLPGAPRQLLTSGVDANNASFWQDVVSSGVNGFSIQLTNITKEFVLEAHSRLLSVAVWTVNDPRLMTEALSYDVDAILTDDLPALFRSIKMFYNRELEENIFGVQRWVLVVSVVVVFVVTATSTGAAVFFWRRSNRYMLLDSKMNRA